MKRKEAQAKRYRTLGKANLACSHYNSTDTKNFYRVEKIQGFKLWQIVMTDMQGKQTFK